MPLPRIRKSFSPRSLADLRARAAADDDRFDLRQIAFQVFRIGEEQPFANDESQNGVAEKFQPLVRFQAVQRARGVRKRRQQQRFVAKYITDALFTLRNLFWRQFLCPHGPRAPFMRSKAHKSDQEDWQPVEKGDLSPFSTDG